MKNIQQIIFLMILLLGSCAHAMNILVPYDSLIMPDYDARYRVQCSVFAERGYQQAKGFNDDGDRVDVLRILHSEQNALAMLKGFTPTSSIGQLRTLLGANDDGIRGHLKVSGRLDLDFGIAFAIKFFFKNYWSLGVYLPVYKMELKDVVFEDQTQNVTEADRRVKTLLTDNFVENVKNLSDGFDLRGWQRSGAGDLTVLLRWFRDFYQHKPFLKNVRVNFRSGLSIPTGKRIDEDKLFAIPFGNDGAFAIPFGVGLDVTMGKYTKLGLDVELTHIFGNTRARRIKTDEDQTELILLKKTQVHRDFGLTQRFDLYVQFYKFLKGLSFKVGYQFKKHGDDEFALKTNAFSQKVANTALRLQEWTMHHIVTNTSYDFGVHLNDNARIRPQLSIFTRFPFNGKQVAVVPTVGATFSIDF